MPSLLTSEYAKAIKHCCDDKVGAGVPSNATGVPVDGEEFGGNVVSLITNKVGTSVGLVSFEGEGANV